MRTVKTERYKRKIDDLREWLNNLDEDETILKDKQSALEKELKEWKRKVSVLENSSSGMFRSEKIMYGAKIKEIKKEIKNLDDSIYLIEKEKKKTNLKINKLIIKAGCRSEIIENAFEKETTLKKEYINDFFSVEEIKEMNGDIVIDEYGINISYVAFENYIHIQWEKTKIMPRGRIKIYRNTGGFSREEFNEQENSIMVADSKEDIGVSKDGGSDILRNTTYYYTVKYNVTEENKISYDTEGIKTNNETFKKNEKPYNIARFKLVLLEKSKQEEPGKSRIEVLEERLSENREEQKIKLSHKLEQMFINLTSRKESKETLKLFLEQTKEKLLNERMRENGGMNKDDGEEVAAIIEDLEDRGNGLIADLDKE